MHEELGFASEHWLSTDERYPKFNTTNMRLVYDTAAASESINPMAVHTLGDSPVFANTRPSVSSDGAKTPRILSSMR